MNAQMTDLAFIIVVYNQVFYDTATYKTLIKSIEAGNHLNWKLFVYDNSDIDKWNVHYEHLEIGDKLYYFHNPNNAGISVAYNHMCRSAVSFGITWAIFMDQDTEFPTDALQKYAAASANDIKIKAPVIYTQDFVFSPMRFFGVKTFKAKAMKPGVYNINKYLIINSGLMVNLDFFREIGGYNERIRLDFSDDQFIKRARRHTTSFEVLDIKCLHDYSYYSSGIRTALSRYKMYLKDLRQCERNSLSDHISYSITSLIHLKNLSLRYKSLQFMYIYFYSLFRNS